MPSAATSRLPNRSASEMATIFPKNPLMSIPANDPIWTTILRRVRLLDGDPPRPPADEARRAAGLKSRSAASRRSSRAIRFGDRYGVIFSEFDLSCALEKHDSLECRGYTREDAARIGFNVMLYGMQQ